MAPEQVRGLPVDHRADLFAFGAVLYELLSGAARFPAPRRRRRWRRSSTRIRRISARPKAPIPPALARIVDRCLEKRPVGAIPDGQRSRLRAAGLVGHVERVESRSAPADLGLHGGGWLGRRGVAAGHAGAPRVSARPGAAVPRRRFASRFLRASNLAGPGNSACPRTAVTWRSRGAARMGSAALDPRQWIHSKSGPCPVPRSAAPRLLLFGLPTDGSWRSMPAESSRK